MELSGRSGRLMMEEYLPHLLMTLSFAAMAIFIVFVQSLISGGVSPTVLIVYEHIIASFFLSILAFLFERNRPPLTLNVFLWSFLLGFLQVCLGQLVLAVSLGYISATFQTTALNTSSAVTFLMAVAFRREILSFCTINGQAKLWGIMVSVAGATIMVLWTGPRLGGLSSLEDDYSNVVDRVIGCLMIMCALFAGASSNLLVEHVSIKYPAEMTLSAMMCFSGTLQAAIIAGVTERSASAWKISFHGSYEVLGILYGAIFVAGLAYYALNWCIHKRGPVFASGFSPLLIVFTFILETFFLGRDAHLGSIVGAIFVIGGLYMLLWAKADDNQDKLNTNLPFAGTYEQLS